MGNEISSKKLPKKPSPASKPSLNPEPVPVSKPLPVDEPVPVSKPLPVVEPVPVPKPSSNAVNNNVIDNLYCSFLNSFIQLSHKVTESNNKIYVLDELLSFLTNGEEAIDFLQRYPNIQKILMQKINEFQNNPKSQKEKWFMDNLSKYQIILWTTLNKLTKNKNK